MSDVPECTTCAPPVCTCGVRDQARKDLTEAFFRGVAMGQRDTRVELVTLAEDCKRAGQIAGYEQGRRDERDSVLAGDGWMTAAQVRAVLKQAEALQGDVSESGQHSNRSAITEQDLNDHALNFVQRDDSRNDSDTAVEAFLSSVQRTDHDDWCRDPHCTGCWGGES